MAELTRARPAGAGRISLERVAINVNDARIPDNAGAQPVDTPVIQGAPAAYFTTLPIKAMFAAMMEIRIVSRLIARSMSVGSTRPLLSTGR